MVILSRFRVQKEPNLDKGKFYGHFSAVKYIFICKDSKQNRLI